MKNNYYSVVTGSNPERDFFYLFYLINANKNVVGGSLLLSFFS